MRAQENIFSAPSRRLIPSLIGCSIVASALLTGRTSRADVFHYLDRDGRPHEVVIRTADSPADAAPALPAASAPFGYPFSTIVREASTTYAVPVELILAVMTVESGFNPRAVSRAGALGLMQLMPTTAVNLYVFDPFDPRQNTLGGTRQLRTLINAYGGDVPFALAAYNAGTAAVEHYSGIPPFPETKRYVENVLRLYHLYLERGPGIAALASSQTSTPEGRPPTAVLPASTRSSNKSMPDRGKAPAKRRKKRRR